MKFKFKNLNEAKNDKEYPIPEDIVSICRKFSGDIKDFEVTRYVKEETNEVDEIDCYIRIKFGRDCDITCLDVNTKYKNTPNFRLNIDSWGSLGNYRDPIQVSNNIKDVEKQLTAVKNANEVLKVLTKKNIEDIITKDVYIK